MDRGSHAAGLRPGLRWAREESIQLGVSRQLGRASRYGGVTAASPRRPVFGPQPAFALSLPACPWILADQAGRYAGRPVPVTRVSVQASASPPRPSLTWRSAQDCLPKLWLMIAAAGRAIGPISPTRTAGRQRHAEVSERAEWAVLRGRGAGPQGTVSECAWSTAARRLTIRPPSHPSAAGPASAWSATARRAGRPPGWRG
jgi:hypothetical protein